MRWPASVAGTPLRWQECHREPDERAGVDSGRRARRGAILVERICPRFSAGCGRTDSGRVRSAARHDTVRPDGRGHRAVATVGGPEPVRVARQPILDRAVSLIGYELLFRGLEADGAEIRDDREATAAVIVDGLLDIGFSELVGDTLAYLNVSRDFLLSVRPLPLPPQRVVLELLEEQLVDDELLEVLGELVDGDFTIALDDFVLTAATERLLAFAQIVKVDVLAHPVDALEALVAQIRARRPAVTLLAEKVESREQFDQCRALGFHAFQGYFFARPSRMPQRRLPSQGLGALRAMAELSATEDFDEIDEIITRDAGLSMRLLRYANSASVSLPRRVGSVQEGLAWLGALTVRRFALMVALAGARDVPNVLLVTALVRARMCHLLSGHGDTAEGDSYFTVGLFSVADALADAPMQTVIEQLPFRRDIASALLDGEGALGAMLTLVTAYEQGDFVGAAQLVRSRSDVEAVCREARNWARRSIAELS
jgi:EAL and modified HD-GYP domain-containing signal transduction protein